jgi:SAM-dependent methyltransferase
MNAGSHLEGGLTVSTYRDQFQDPQQVTTYETEQYNPTSWSSLLWLHEKKYLGSQMDELCASGARNDHYVDFACGSGRVLEFVAPRYEHSVGVDVSSEMLRRAAERVPSATFQCRNVATSPASLEHKADLITCFRFLLNADPADRRAALRWMRDQLADGGVIILNNHGAARSHKIILFALRRRWSAGRRLAGNVLSDRAVQLLVKEAGLDVVRIQGFGYLGGTFLKWLSFERMSKIQELLGRIPLLHRLAEDQIYTLCKAGDDGRLYGRGRPPLRSVLARTFPTVSATYKALRSRLERMRAGDGSVKVFEDIVARNGWHDPDSVSGTGSNLKQTEMLRRELAPLLARLGVQTLLDAPCGDFHWMRNVDLTGIDYTGLDIVASLVQRCQKEYGGVERRFVQGNIITDVLPRTDAILSRDCLSHLSNEHVWRALENFRAGGAKYLLATTYPSRRYNWDIVTGKWRPINLCAHPFSLPEPLHAIVEGSTEWYGDFSDKTLALWRLDALPLR